MAVKKCEEEEEGRRRKQIVLLLLYTIMIPFYRDHVTLIVHTFGVEVSYNQLQVA